MTGRGHLHFKTDLLLVLFLCFQVTIACRIRWFEEEDSTSKKEKTKQKTKATVERVTVLEGMLKMDATEKEM